MCEALSLRQVALKLDPALVSTEILPFVIVEQAHTDDAKDAQPADLLVLNQRAFGKFP